MYVFGGKHLMSLHRYSSLDDLWILNTSQLFDERMKRSIKWKQVLSGSHWPPPRLAHSATINKEETGMIIFGGTNGTSVLSDIWIYSFSTQQWEILTYSRSDTSMNVARYGHIAVVFGNYLVVHGGCTVDFNWGLLFGISSVPIPDCHYQSICDTTIYFYFVYSR